MLWELTAQPHLETIVVPPVPAGCKQWCVFEEEGRERSKSVMLGNELIESGVRTLDHLIFLDLSNSVDLLVRNGDELAVNSLWAPSAAPMKACHDHRTVRAPPRPPHTNHPKILISMNLDAWLSSCRGLGSRVLTAHTYHSPVLYARARGHLSILCCQDHSIYGLPRFEKYQRGPPISPNLKVTQPGIPLLPEGAADLLHYANLHHRECLARLRLAAQRASALFLILISLLGRECVIYSVFPMQTEIVLARCSGFQLLQHKVNCELSHHSGRDVDGHVFKQIQCCDSVSSETSSTR
ncbi:hypothetical protein HYDPIDRAFT_115198 [Hydnomerulius pinastri MD-312]|uniref:Uncharacterized protein n=1 Tax=Hydnomerulius pinastri MD-312 TaxID=994086 RepID=A0A0C9VVB1_9AGAM|nr:hypothetical protein HYDPIDRAFT_115198 [Hydnomerulius pinastri MD-312]